MHYTAMDNCRLFFDTYAIDFNELKSPRVLEIGSQDVNGSIRACAPESFEYVGVDFVAGKGVDVILDDPYHLPFEDGSFDIVLSNSCFEHSEMFWLLFDEIMRVLKPSGLFYLNVPSNGYFHRYPVDCWRFYPDSGSALVTWNRRGGGNAALLESYTSKQSKGVWNDFVAIFVKDEVFAHRYEGRVTDRLVDFTNGLSRGRDGIANEQTIPEDQSAISLVRRFIRDHLKRRLKVRA